MNKKGIAVCTAAIIALGVAGGCTLIKGSPKAVINEATADEEKPANKIFEPGKHCFFRRYGTSNLSGQVSIPNGYEILEIETTDSFQYIVWFINTETVEAEAVKANGSYSYSKAGIVVKKNKTK